MRKSAKLVSLCMCVALFMSVFFSFPQTALAVDIVSADVSIAGAFDNGTVVNNTGRNNQLISLSPGIYHRVTSIAFNYYFVVEKAEPGDTFTVEGSLLSSCGFSGLTGFVNCTLGSGAYNFSGTSFSFSFEIDTEITEPTKFNIGGICSPTGVKSGYDDRDAAFGLNVSVEQTSETNGLLNTLIGWVEDIFENLKQLPNKISGFFSDLKNNLSDWFDSVGDWFSDLGDSLSDWFSDIGDWFVNLGNEISGFFTDIGDRISNFFEKLWNRIYWGNENGESEYDPPVFGGAIDEVLDKLDEYIKQLDDTNEQIQNATDTSVAYVEQGTAVINSIFGVFPSVMTALVVFGIVFIFCRKVVGR